VKLNWGVGIAVVYAVFAAGTLGFVALAMSQPVELVSADYYARSLQHDERLRAEARVRALGGAFSCGLSDEGLAVVVSLPPDQVAGARGTITLYRPSDARADRLVPLTLDARGRQRVELPEHGRWVLKVQWTEQDRSYYHEQAVVAR
jgi:nitrogen fixation protein FixH